MYKIAQQLLRTMNSISSTLYRTLPNFRHSRSMTKSVDSGLNRFFSGIGKQESNMNYGAINRMSGALGKYQFMPNTLKGLGINPAGFLKNPQLQETAMRRFTMQNVNTANSKGFNININDGINAREAQILSGMHYGGAGYLNKLRSGRGLNTIQAGNYPSFNDYSSSVINNMKGF